MHLSAPLPRLVVLADPMSGERTEHALSFGARLSDELMRLHPHGIEGAWRLYDGQVAEGCELPREAAPAIVLGMGDVIVMVRTPGTPDLWLNVALAVFFTLASRALAPHPTRRPNQSLQESADSGNNQLAGQTNVLRPAARVPEILGQLRAYPDLLTVPVEWWSGTSQTIQQWFVLGRGAYVMDDLRLGDTQISNVVGMNWDKWGPGTPVPYVDVVRESATVHSISLDASSSASVISGVNFAAGPKTMSTPSPIGLTAGIPIVISNTASVNDARFWVVSVPPTTQTTGPYVYVLEGPVANQVNVNPTITPLAGPYYDANTLIDIDATFDLVFIKAYIATLQGDDPIWITGAGHDFHGFIGTVEYIYDGEAYVGVYISVVDVYGTPFVFSVNEFNKMVRLRLWVGHMGTPLLRADATPFADDQPPPSAWHAVPVDKPQQIWIDVEFPQGLAYFKSGSRIEYAVTVKAEFKRRGVLDPQAAITFQSFRSTLTQRLRFTQKVYVNRPSTTPLPAGAYDLTLPGTEVIEVRLTRMTPLPVDTLTDQYNDETRWHSLRGFVRLPEFTYPDVTIIQLALSNTTSATSLGENTFNLLATRVLPTWTPSGGWSAAAPTRKWADNFVKRCQAPDGAGRADAYIDLAGIYDLQAQLDALDGGAQGQIALTLDQQQDIDSELAQIADVVRATVYRVGRKIYVARDQGNLPALALFNGRSKTAEGESVSVRMKADDENDAIQVQWVDEFSNWKQREYEYKEVSTPTNVLRIGAQLANWPQAYRRALFEFNKIRYRREAISVGVTEDGRICRPGDVVNITDDIANLALDAGEVIHISGNQLVLDRDVDFSAPGVYVIMLRALEGIAIDLIGCTAVAGSPNRVQLARGAHITIKGRDESMGTLYAFYNNANATLRPWLLTAVEMGTEGVTLSGVNYTERVYEGDAATLPTRPLLPGLPA